MQDILAAVDWQGDRAVVLGLTYHWTGREVNLGAQVLGPAGNRVEAEELLRPDATARVLAVLTPAARAALQGIARARHKKRGSLYRVLGQGRLQTGAPLADDAALVIYRAEVGGALWARPVVEFQDGRFDVEPALAIESPESK